MNGRERFIKTMDFDPVDRPPLFEDGLRDEVVHNWYKQGLRREIKLENIFTFDKREEIEPDLEPIPSPTYWPKTLAGLKKFAIKYDPHDQKRLPDDWAKKVIEWKTREFPLILRVHRGYFLTMGVHGWHRFTDAIQLLVDEPKLVETWMNLFAEFSCQILDRILNEIEIDAVLFSEPIGGNHGPLISPTMYSTIVLNSYQPIIEVLHNHKIKRIIYRTYANTRALLPSVVKAGFNCLWACECNPDAMDYLDIRREFGKDLRLIGGIDSDTLRHNQQGIAQSITKIVPQLLEDGGYIPLADGRVREDVPYNNYVLYRKMLETLVGISP
jgi:Uroporphyrinogen decarboxylase (URO-D)